MNPLLCRLAFNSAVRRRVWRKLAIQAQNGLDIDTSLSMLRDQAAESGRSRLAELYDHILTLKGSGETLDVALEGAATPEEIQLIASGQEAGRLPEALLMAVDLQGAKGRIRTAIVGVVAYPLLLLSMCIVFLLIISVQVIPETALISDPAKWTGMSAMLYSLCTFTASWKGAVTLLLLILLGVGIALSLPRWTGLNRRPFEGMPPWSVYRMVVGSVWLFTVATLMKSGLPLTQIMSDMLASSQTTPYLRERIQAIFVQQAAGANLGEAMFNCGMNFPDLEIVDELRTYAKLPDFESQLVLISKQWLDEGLESIESRSKIFGVVCTLFIVVLVCLLGISITEMQSQTMNIGG